MNPILSILCTIGAIVAYVLIVFLLSFAFVKALGMDIADDYDLIMSTSIIQFFITMVLIAVYFSGFMGDGV